MILAKKVRLIPTPEQEKVLKKHAGAARFAYNYCKRISDRYYKLFGKSVSQLALQKRFTKIKKRKKYEWLKDINAQVPKQASRDFDAARKNSFKKYKNGSHTSYKSKKDVIQRFYANYERLIIGKKVVHIQSIGEVKTSQQLPRNKKPSNPRVTFDGRHWWISVGFQEDFELQELTNESIGVDVGLKELFVASNGMKERNINKDAKVKKLLKRKKSAQRDMSRRFKKGVKIQSAGYEKAKAEHLRLSRKIMNIRNNHIHQATAKLVKTNEDCCGRLIYLKPVKKQKTIESIFISKIKLLLSMFIIQVREVWHCVCKS